jgi:NTE family protein
VIGLVLTAGGARGAYQAGVLRRIGEIPSLRDGPSPFPVIAGASAGAINGAGLAGWSRALGSGTERLARLWCGLSVSDVFRTDLLALARNGLDLALDFSLGGVLGGGRVQGLLDASPLRRLLARTLPLDGIEAAIGAGALYAVAITATSYHSGKSYTFIQGAPGHPTWMKRRRVTLSVPLTLDHVLASAAIPLVFPPVRIESEIGAFWFGDGGLRLVTPLSPAIRLGADRILAIGIRCHGSADELSRAELVAGEATDGPGDAIARPPLAQICGVFLNAIFLDHLDTDLDHLVRMNELLEAHGPIADQDSAPAEPIREIAPLAIHPSEDLALVAKTFEHRMPAVIRHLMDGLGTPDAQSADLMSYLLFDSLYTRELVELGSRDAAARIDEIEAFLRSAPPGRSRSAAT